MIKRFIAVSLIGLGLTVAFMSAPYAQEAKGKQSGLSKNSKDPINIEADSLEVFDKEGKAVYSGNVIVTQGETVMKAKKMQIFYVRSEESQAAPADGDAGAAIKRVEAEGDVIILEKDQIATGEKGIYEATTDIMTMTGNVALSKGQNVTKGQKLVYNLGTGIATALGVNVGSAGAPVSGSASPALRAP